ncbi:hypothetical protein VF21_00320 [Pseudogymnoascus sp. 05NY08]|nr:hypothetical protein VF21_00320 [Pseudogymnoascus sp. 05NY08]
MPSKQHIRLTSSRAYSHERHHGGPISDLQPSSTDTSSSSCSPPPPYDAIRSSSYCRSRLSPTARVSPTISPEFVYRSPFRGRITPALSCSRCPKRRKLLSVHAAKKSLLVLELFGFLTAYTTLSEDQRIWVVEKVFEDVDWEGCADMDEGKGDGLRYPYNLYDQNDAGPGGLCRWILELSEAHITTAFGELATRIVEAGWEVEGILIPPGAETLVEVQESPDVNPTWFNWTVAYGHAGPTEPITYQAVPELTLPQVPLYDHNPMGPQIAAERAEYLQNYLQQCSAEELQQARLDKTEEIKAHIFACEEREEEAREHYRQLVGEPASALVDGARDNNSSMFSEIASGVSMADLSSIRSSGSTITLNRTQIDDWAFNCTSDGANSKAPLLEPSLPLRRSGSPKQKAADDGFGDQWEFGDVPTSAEEEERMMQHALRASMRVSTEKLPSPSIDNAVHWEDPDKVPWLNSRFQGNIFYNNLPIVQSEPLIVMQARMDLDSGSEPPPPPKNTKLPEPKPMEDVEMTADEPNQERVKLEVADKGKDQMRPGKRPDSKKGGVLSDLKALSVDLNRKFASKSREQGKVVKDTVEETKHLKPGRAKPVEPVTENVSELVKSSATEAWYVPDSDYPHSDHRKSDDESIEDKTPTERLAEAFREDELRRSDPYRAPSPEPKKRGIPDITIVLPEPKRDEALETIAKEASRIRKWDKAKAYDFAERAENNSAYHKAKAAEEAGPETQRPNAEPDLRHFNPSHKAQDSVRRSNEKKRVEKRESDERKSKEQSGDGRSKQAPVKSMIPPESPA